MEQHNSSKKFFLGLVSGLCLGLFVCLVCVALFGGVIFYSKNVPEISKEENGIDKALTQEEGLNWDSVVTKMELLEGLIDYYYLNDYEKKDLAEGAYKGLMDSLGDPYSTYYTKEEYDRFREDNEGVYYGIGVQVSQNVKTGIVTIVKPFKGGPGFEAGLLPGDTIVKVAGQDITGMDINEIVSYIKGKEGTTVDITFFREGDTDYRTVTVERRQIEVPTVEYQMLENKIGYISVMEFDEVTDEQFRAAIKDLEKQGIKGMIVDVRDNLGGSLNVVTDMLDRLLPEGLIVYTEDKYGNREEKKSKGSESFKKPLVVLTNEHSASASEIFAGAIQDYGIGTILGTTTFGKGIVQSLLPLSDGTAIKITISKYYTPKGRNIHGTGIEPDIEVELDEELRSKPVVSLEEDNQVQAAIEVLLEQIQ